MPSRASALLVSGPARGEEEEEVRVLAVGPCGCSRQRSLTGAKHVTHELQPQERDDACDQGRRNSTVRMHAPLLLLVTVEAGEHLAALAARKQVQ